MSGRWDATRRRTLTALCDTYVAPVRPPRAEIDDPTGFWGRTASDLGVPDRVAAQIDERVPADDRDGMLRVLDLLRTLGLPWLPQGGREAIIGGLARVSDDVAAALDGYRWFTLTEAYGRPGPDRHNPNWEQLGYPGPPDVLPPQRERLSTVDIAPRTGRADLDADVVVIGSGSGGSVVAAELATSGLDVIVLEAGAHHDEVTFPPDELTALRDLYWRGGVQRSSDDNVAILAGATVGGGSTINWANCVRPPDHVRDLWAHHHGLKGLADGFDEHLEAVYARIAATPAAADMNGPNQRLRDGAEVLGWSCAGATRNIDTSRYDPATAGHIGFGDRTGSKLGTQHTYLSDAVAAGARLLVRTTAWRIHVEGGRAAGVTARHVRGDGRRVAVTVRSRHVVLACGALETPALLLRSTIGGPAVGRFLRVHPVPNLPAVYPEVQDGWWGPPQACIVDQHVTGLAAHGFLIETPHHHPGIAAASYPWASARRHKLVIGRSARMASFLAVNRERGAGRVAIDDDGEAVVSYPLDDPFDHELIRRSIVAMVRLHAAAGAEAIVDIHPRADVWQRGDDVDEYAERISSLPLGARQRILFSAHQMGSARMGLDAETSVADPDGELHDTPGVWIGDTSAFPTAVGSNPMLTCMALARRTSHALLARS